MGRDAIWELEFKSFEEYSKYDKTQNGNFKCIYLKNVKETKCLKYNYFIIL